MWLAAVLFGAVAVALIFALRFPNAVGSWGIAIVLVAVPLLAGVVSAPSRFGALTDLNAYLPFISDLTLLLVGLSAIIVIDSATARRGDRGASVLWIGLVASLPSLALAMHWNSGFRRDGAAGPSVDDVSVLLSYVTGLLLLSLVLRLITAKD